MSTKAFITKPADVVVLSSESGFPVRYPIGLPIKIYGHSIQPTASYARDPKDELIMINNEDFRFVESDEDVLRWDTSWKFHTSTESERRWIIEEVHSKFRQNSYRDWEGFSLDEDSRSVVETVVQVARNFVEGMTQTPDEKMEMCNCIVDITLLLIGEDGDTDWDSTDDMDGYLTNLTWAISNLLTTRAFVKSGQNWYKDGVVIEEEEEESGT